MHPVCAGSASVAAHDGRLVPWEVCVFLSRPVTGLLIAAGFLIPLIAQTGAFRAQEATPVAESMENGPALLGGDLPGDPQIQLVQVASGLQFPVNVAFPPDDSGRIFVAEKGGTIRILTAHNEQGLLSMAFHPDYAQNGRFFIDYNDAFISGAIVVSEFRVNDRDPN